MVCYSLQSGYDIGEDHAGFGRTLSLGQTLYMFLLQFAFLLVYLILQSNNLLHMGFIALGEHFYSITNDLVDHFQHISQFLLGFLTDGNAFFLTLSGSIRHVPREEKRRQADAVRMARMGEGKDSISVEKLNISDTYTVGIDLEKAISNPGSDFDLVLREGDVLFIPEYINTVKISGAVMYPNTVLYKRGESLRYYINQAGGYGNLAKKKKAYVVYMNGTVSRLKSRDKKAIEPGCEIIVPSKEEKKRMSTAEILGMGSTTASIAAMIATMVNLFK